jgi:hypothetical protein
MKPIEFLNRNNIYLFYYTDEMTTAPAVRVVWRNKLMTEHRYTHTCEEINQKVIKSIDDDTNMFLLMERRIKNEKINDK